MSVETVNCGVCYKDVNKECALQVADSQIYVCRSHVIPEWSDSLEELATASEMDDEWFALFDKLLTVLTDNWALLLLHTPLELDIIQMGALALTPDDMDEKQKDIQSEIIEAAVDVIENPEFLKNQQDIETDVEP